MNTDQNASTGDATVGGADYVTELDAGAVGLFQWNGTTYVAAPSQASLTYAYDATGATIRVSAADLGKTKAIGFVVEVGLGHRHRRQRRPGLHERARRRRARPWATGSSATAS